MTKSTPHSNSEPPAAAQPTADLIGRVDRMIADTAHQVTLGTPMEREFFRGWNAAYHNVRNMLKEHSVAPAAALSSQEGCTECVAKDFRIATMQDSIDGCARRVQELSKRLAEKPDVVCMHGTAMDVHCCNCHSGFIFDAHHVCAPAAAQPAKKDDLAWRLGCMADAVLSAKVGPQARFFTRQTVDEIVLLLREAEKRIVEGR